jgi:hypothetical protein
MGFTVICLLINCFKPDRDVSVEYMVAVCVCIIFQACVCMFSSECFGVISA